MSKMFLKHSFYAQAAFTLISFAVVVLFSYFIMKTTVRNHLSQNSTLALDLAMTKIDTELRGPETTLRTFAEAIQERILQGEDLDGIREFLLSVNPYLAYYNKGGSSPVTIFGIFYTLSDEPTLIHSKKWTPFDGYDHQNRPWYKAAMAGGGEPKRSEIYLDYSLEKYVFAIAQTIQDGSGKHLGIVSLQVPIDIIGEIVTKTAQEQGGYGMVLGQNLKVHAHANTSFVGMKVPDPALPFSIFYDNFTKGEDIFERQIISFAGTKSLAFFRKTQDGWYYGTVVPEEPYYASITKIWYILIALGVVASVFLIYVLASTDLKKNRATALTNALNKMSELFLTQGGKPFEEIMNAGGRLLVDIVDIDRFSIFRNSEIDGVLCMTQIYRWEKASGGTTKINNSFINVPYAKIAPSCEKAFKRGKSINGAIRSLTELTEKEVATLSKLGMISVFAPPIYVNDTLWGYALFEDHVKDRAFSSDLAETMRSAAFLFANAVMRAELEENLASERDFSHKLINAAPMGVNIWDEHFNIITCNDAIENIFGCTKEYYASNFDKFSPEFQPDGTKSASKAKYLLANGAIGETVVTEWEHCSAKGEPIPCEVTQTNLVYNNKQVQVVYIYDLRNIKKMEKAMLNAQQAQALLDAVPLSCILLDKNANALTCNNSAVELFGLHKKDDIQHMLGNITPEYQPNGSSSREVVIETMSKAYNDGYLFIPDWMHRNLSGEMLPCEVTLVRVEYGGDYVVAGYARDMRAVREQERKTREADERARILFDIAPLACCMFDQNNQIIDCNQEIVKMFEIPDKEFFIDKFFTLLMPEYQPSGELSSEVAARNGQIAFENGYHRFESMHQKLSGEPMPSEVTMVRINYKGESAMAAYFRDLTEQRAIVQLAKQQAEAEAANKAKSSFLASMSHEIRTPMNAILGITEIQLQNDDLPDESKNALGIIYNSGYTLLGIINDLLDLSKIEAGKLEISNYRYEMASFINDTINLNTARIGSKPIDFKLHVSEDLPFELIGDELRVKQILNNLLSNAFKYTDSGEVSLSFLAKTVGEKVTLTVIVRDTGHGMTDEQVKNLFDAYSRFNIKANRYVEGTGLGMNIVQHLLKKMGGDISVNSKPGEGTEVILHLTQGSAGSEKLGRELAESLMGFRLSGLSRMKKMQVVREHMPYGKVLVVDDMETNLYVARGFLLPYGLTVETVLSGKAAIKKIESGNIYDIIFMDHMMPEMDGIETARIIRSKGYTYPIVALTANAVAGQSDMFMANGFNGFISKPIDIRELNASLNKHVKIKQQPAKVIEMPHVGPELIKIFTYDAEKAIAVLQEYEARKSYESDDLQMYIINVHALKSALANVGETELSAFAKELEFAGKNKSTEFISKKTHEFLEKLQTLVNNFKESIEENDTSEISSEDMDYLQQKLRSVKESCAAYDVNAATFALKEIRHKTWPSMYVELFDAIDEHLLCSNFDEAAALCDAEVNK